MAMNEYQRLWMRAFICENCDSPDSELVIRESNFVEGELFTTKNALCKDEEECFEFLGLNKELRGKIARRKI